MNRNQQKHFSRVVKQYFSNENHQNFGFLDDAVRGIKNALKEMKNYPCKILAREFLYICDLSEKPMLAKYSLYRHILAETEGFLGKMKYLWKNSSDKDYVKKELEHYNNNVHALIQKKIEAADLVFVKERNKPLHNLCSEVSPLAAVVGEETRLNMCSMEELDAAIADILSFEQLVEICILTVKVVNAELAERHSQQSFVDAVKEWVEQQIELVKNVTENDYEYHLPSEQKSTEDRLKFLLGYIDRGLARRNSLAWSQIEKY